MEGSRSIILEALRGTFLLDMWLSLACDRPNVYYCFRFWCHRFKHSTFLVYKIPFTRNSWRHALCFHLCSVVQSRWSVIRLCCPSVCLKPLKPHDEWAKLHSVRNFSSTGSSLQPASVEVMSFTASAQRGIMFQNCCPLVDNIKGKVQPAGG